MVRLPNPLSHRPQRDYPLGLARPSSLKPRYPMLLDIRHPRLLRTRQHPRWHLDPHPRTPHNRAEAHLWIPRQTWICGLAGNGIDIGFVKHGS